MTQEKNILSTICMGIILLVLYSCPGNTTLLEPSIAEDITIEWELLGNTVNNGDRFRASFSMENRGERALENTNWSLFFNFRHHIIEESTSNNADINFINGDFYRLTPTSSFNLQPGEETTVQFEGSGNIIKDDRAPAGLYFVFTDEEGNEIDTTLVENYSFQRIEPSQVAKTLPMVPTVESRYLQNQPLTKIDIADVSRILPTPREIEYASGTTILSGEYQVNYGPGLEAEAQFLSKTLGHVTGSSYSSNESTEEGANIISLKIDRQHGADASPEAYQLDISKENGINIRGNGAAGVFYGIQSLLSLIPVDTYQAPQATVELPAVAINDAPRFEYRGMHLDVSRNFNRKEAVKKLLDLMAFYKLNKFHFHLTDDEGWRLQIEELPELTGLGAFRGHTLDDSTHLQPAYGSGPYPNPEYSYGSGYYTREDYMEIIRYAHERHIEVIPEFDVPGHARAAIKAMESRYHRLVQKGREEEANEYLLTDWQDESEYLSAQEFDDNVISVCKESAYRFFETVVEDVSEMYAEAGVPLNTIHMGGDEVPEGSWEKSPECEQFISTNDAVEDYDDLPNYFVDRLTEIMAERDLTLAGWQEIAMRGGGHGSSEIDPSFSDQEVTIYSWDNFTSGNRDLGYRVANAGFPVVLCNATNLYFELAYNWDPAEPGDYFGGTVDTRKAFEFMPMNFTDPMHEEESDENYARLNSNGLENIKGIQAHLWSEPIKGADSLEYFYAPKIVGLAERAWAPQPEWEMMEDREQRSEIFMEDWNRFANRIGQQEMPRLDYLVGGYNYRLPLPGAVIKDGMLHANIEFPGLAIRYSTDGSNPTRQSKLYEGPVEVQGRDIKLRAFDSRGRGSRIATVSE